MVLAVVRLDVDDMRKIEGEKASTDTRPRSQHDVNMITTAAVNWT